MYVLVYLRKNAHCQAAEFRKESAQGTPRDKSDFQPQQIDFTQRYYYIRDKRPLIVQPRGEH